MQRAVGFNNKREGGGGVSWGTWTVGAGSVLALCPDLSCTEKEPPARGQDQSSLVQRLFLPRDLTERALYMRHSCVQGQASSHGPQACSTERTEDSVNRAGGVPSQVPSRRSEQGPAAKPLLGAVRAAAGLRCRAQQPGSGCLGAPGPASGWIMPSYRPSLCPLQ